MKILGQEPYRKGKSPPMSARSEAMVLRELDVSDGPLPPLGPVVLVDTVRSPKEPVEPAMVPRRWIMRSSHVSSWPILHAGNLPALPVQGHDTDLPVVEDFHRALGLLRVCKLELGAHGLPLLHFQGRLDGLAERHLERLGLGRPIR